MAHLCDNKPMTRLPLHLIKNALCALLFFGASAVSLAQACEYPRAPAVPNGELADKQQMREANQSVRAYLAKAEAYLACLQAMESDPKQPLPKRQAEINIARHNAAVDEMHRVTDAYNVAVRTFKARQN